MAEWMEFGDGVLCCSHCGMAAPYARYRRCQGVNAYDLADYCPHCGAQMDAFPDCAECEDAHCGEWRENGICFACRQNAWIKGRKHRKSLIEEA